MLLIIILALAVWWVIYKVLKGAFTALLTDTIKDEAQAKTIATVITVVIIIVALVLYEG